MGAFCPIDLTNPSHISIFTSKYPKNHGVYTNWTPMEKEHVTLAEILKNQGYKTAALVSSNHLNTNISGLGKGFDFFRSISLGQVPANETINNALSWIRENADKNFFVWVHLFDPHMPYNPPSPYDKVFDKRYNGWGKIFFDVYNHKISARNAMSTSKEELTQSQKDVLLKAEQGTLPYSDICFNRIGLTEKDMEYVKSLYDGEIKFMDENIGVLFKEMDTLGLSKKTIIIFTADHGESLGEHGIYCDHKGLYENTIHIPFIIYVPGMTHRKINSTVLNMDILPTVLDLLHINVSSEINDGFDGKSLIPLMDGSTEKVRDLFFMEQKNNLAKSIRQGDYKFIMPIKENFIPLEDDYIHQEEMYDLGNDIGERNNLIASGTLDTTPYEVLKATLTAWAGKEWRVKRDSKQLKRLDEEQREKLKALGYIN